MPKWPRLMFVGRKFHFEGYCKECNSSSHKPSADSSLNMTSSQAPPYVFVCLLFLLSISISVSLYRSVSFLSGFYQKKRINSIYRNIFYFRDVAYWKICYPDVSTIRYSCSGRWYSRLLTGISCSPPRSTSPAQSSLLSVLTPAGSLRYYAHFVCVLVVEIIVGNVI